MPMRVAVRCGRRISWRVIVLMVSVMTVYMLVVQGLMGVLVGMTFAKQQHNTKRHRSHRSHIYCAKAVPAQHNRSQCANERGRGEKCGFSRSPEQS